MSWQTEIVAEMRDCEDEQYAAQLLRLIGDERVGLTSLPRLETTVLFVLPVAMLALLVCLALTALGSSLGVTLLWGALSVGVAYVGFLVARAQMRWSTWLKVFRFLVGPGRSDSLRSLYGPNGALRIDAPQSADATVSAYPLEFRPYALEAALRHACELRREGWEQWQALLRRLDKARHEMVSAEDALSLLRSDKWQDRFVASHLLVDIGGEAVPALVAVADRPPSVLAGEAYRILGAIETSSRQLRGQPGGPWHCADHLLRLKESRAIVRRSRATLAYGEAVASRAASGPHDARLRVQVSHLGCPVCGQSRHLVGPIVAVLDDHDQEERRQADNELRVNWLVRRELFDFERAEIVRATDEEVARFILALGNDADKTRGPEYYRRIKCQVLATCELSENTRRALRSVFREVQTVAMPDSAASAVVGRGDAKSHSIQATEDDTPT